MSKIKKKTYEVKSCPKCKMTYSWDGIKCHHCFFPVDHALHCPCCLAKIDFESDLIGCRKCGEDMGLSISEIRILKSLNEILKRRKMENSIDEIEANLNKIHPEVQANVPPPPSQTIKLMREAETLKKGGMSVAGISKQLKKSPGWVTGSLLIVERLPVSVHQAIESNRLSRLTALQLLLCPADKLEKVVDASIKLAEFEGKL